MSPADTGGSRMEIDELQCKNNERPSLFVPHSCRLSWPLDAAPQKLVIERLDVVGFAPRNEISVDDDVPIDPIPRHFRGSRLSAGHTSFFVTALVPSQSRRGP
jgi:hypothetical protein